MLPTSTDDLNPSPNTWVTFALKVSHHALCPSRCLSLLTPSQLPIRETPLSARALGPTFDVNLEILNLQENLGNGASAMACTYCCCPQTFDRCQSS